MSFRVSRHAFLQVDNAGTDYTDIVVDDLAVVSHIERDNPIAFDPFPTLWLVLPHSE